MNGRSAVTTWMIEIIHVVTGSGKNTKESR
jgi:hypothetical protein